MAVTCSGMVTFGMVTTKLLGRIPFVFSERVETNISNVRMALFFCSSVNGFIRIPIKGGSEFEAIPLATSLAAEIA